MTKSELVTNLASSSGVPKRQVEQILDAVVENVVKTVRKGDSLKIPGLGIFRLRRLRARIGRNPQTGEPLKIPARKKVGFTVAKTFKQTVLGTAKK